MTDVERAQEYVDKMRGKLDDEKKDLEKIQEKVTNAEANLKEAEAELKQAVATEATENANRLQREADEAK